MGRRDFFGLVRWEIEEYLNLPVLAFLIASALIAVLATDVTNVAPERVYINLFYGSGIFFMVLTVVAGAFFSRSFAGGIGRGEVKLVLSYPVKRWQLFLSKFTAMFLTIFVVYGLAYSLHLYLDALSVFEPMFYVSLFAFLLQLLLACGVSVALSMVTKNEVMSILAAVLLLLGLDTLAGYESYLSAQGRFRFLFQYFGQLTHGSPPFGENFVATSGDVLTAVMVPIIVFVSLIVISFAYFTRFMEVD